MIPPFQDNGYLPPGIHKATIEEVEARFGLESELHRVQMESLTWLVDLIKPAGVMRLVLNASFVTDIYEPNDVDCVLLLGPPATRDPEAVNEIYVGLPFLQIHVVGQKELDILVNEIFASDRETTPKGLIEVGLWN